jgi:hypothetical protein
VGVGSVFVAKLFSFLFDFLLAFYTVCRCVLSLAVINNKARLFTIKTEIIENILIEKLTLEVIVLLKMIFQHSLILQRHSTS